MTITQARLKEVLRYDADTGAFTWKVSTAPRTTPGNSAGTLHKHGYILIQIDGKSYRAHRLAWLYQTGQVPVGMLDHKDTNKANNVFSNLRPATRTLNAENQRVAHKNNAVGLLGVSKCRNRFAARIRKDGKDIHIGVFDTPQEAHKAYIEQKRIQHKGNTL